MIGVDFDFPNAPGSAQFHDDPVISRTAPPFRFPAVSHILRTTGHDQVVHRAEKHVATGERYAAILDRRKVDDLIRAYAAPIRDDVAVDPKTSHAAIRKNVQSDMSPCLLA